MPKPDMAALVDEAHSALQAGDAPRALAQLLAAWQVTPAAALADAIERVGARAAQGVHAPSGRSDASRDKAWQAAAKTGDPVVRHVLIETITEGYQFADRVNALAKFRDPRVAACAIEQLENVRYGPTHNASDFWSPLFKALVQCADPRTVPRAKKLVAAHERSLGGRLHQNEPKAAVARGAKFVQQLAASAGKPPKLPTAVAKRVAAIVELAGAPVANAVEDATTEQGLLAAIYAAPADDGPRAIYGDWLLERGDPRGEYIALELRGKDEMRAYHLEAPNRTKWMGPLARYVGEYSRATFERGFIAELEVELPTGEKCVAPDPAWATVHTIHNAMPATDEHPMPILHTALDLDAPAFEQLAKLATPPPLETLGWKSRDNDWSPKKGYSAETRRAIAAFAKLELPKLRKLILVGASSWAKQGMRPDQLEWAWQRTPITELVVTAHTSELAAWVRAIEKSKLQRLELVHDDGYPTWRFELARDKQGKLSRLSFLSEFGPFFHGHRIYNIEVIAEAIERMPPDQLTSFELPVHKKTWTLPNRERLARALDHQRNLKTVKVHGFERPKRRATKRVGPATR